MSTNKTQNYRLHAWERKDNFLLDEMNENFDLLDKALKAEAQTRAQQLGTKADAATVSSLDQTVKKLETTKADQTAVSDLDTRKAQVIIGIYKGTGADNTRIEVGKKILAVHIERSSGARDLNEVYGGLAVPDQPLRDMKIDDTGFILSSGYGLNSTVYRYIYVAYVE